jgi:hypothetical protein
MIPAVVPLAFLVAGALAVLGAVATLRSLGPGYRIGRLLATAPRSSIADAIRLAESGASRFVAIEGRIDSDDPFEDDAQRPLVLRRTRIEARAGRRWKRIEDAVEVVPFEVREGLDAIGVDTGALGDGLVVIPRVSAGVVADLADRAPAGYPPDAAARARIDQLSSIEHATVIGWPACGKDGRPVMTAGGGRPLVLSVLAPDEAMRVLAGGERLRPWLAAGLLVLGVALGCVGLLWAGAQAVGLTAMPVALAAGPVAASAGSQPAGGTSPRPSALAGDTRSSGEGPGLVGTPLLAIGGVVLVGLVAVGGTLLYVRLTGGPRRS